MKRNRILLIVTAMSLAFALAAMAQAPGRMGGPGMRGAGQGQAALGQGQLGSPQWLATYLGLSETQIKDWQAIRDAARVDVAPLIEARKKNFDALRALFEADDPIAAEVGALVIANHEIAEDIREIHEDAQERFVLLLEAEQKEKYDQWLAFRKSMPQRGRGGQGQGGPGAGFGGGMGFGQGGGFGPGDGTCPCCED